MPYDLQSWQILDPNEKFVAAKAGNNIGFPEAMKKYLSQRKEDVIIGLMFISVIDTCVNAAENSDDVKLAEIIVDEAVSQNNTLVSGFFMSAF